jgi:2-oxoisovalerate dehydrogenase E2 component (dihydrolipoyl transacylase)
MAVRDFLLPDLGEGLEDAEVVAWRVVVGERVELNQVLVEVNTAKALVEIPAPWEGVVEVLHAAEGDVVKVGLPLVSIRVDGDEEARPKRTAHLVGYGVEEEEPAVVTRPASPSRKEGEDESPVATSPPVRKLAKELGVELSAVKGTGPGGRVTREDVLAASAPDQTPPGELNPVTAQGMIREIQAHSRPSETGSSDERVPIRGVRRLTAEKMALSAREIPHVTTFLTVDASAIEAFRSGFEPKVTALPVIVRAFVEILKDHRYLNASFDSNASEIVLRGDVNVGIATDTDRGLLVPVVRGADRMGIGALSAEISRLVEAARAGRSGPEELTGGTVTVTNVGSFGAEFGTPIINHPESAILAVGVIEPRALVVDGVVEARPAVTLSLSFDHRVLDGAEAGRALRDLGAVLQSPDKLAGLPR